MKTRVVRGEMRKPLGKSTIRYKTRVVRGEPHRVRVPMPCSFRNGGSSSSSSSSSSKKTNTSKSIVLKGFSAFYCSLSRVFLKVNTTYLHRFYSKNKKYKSLVSPRKLSISMLFLSDFWLIFERKKAGNPW